jgi:hypothetical protein
VGLTIGLGPGVNPAQAAVSGYYTNPGGHPSRVNAAVDSCHSGPSPADRYAIFSGQMTNVPHADSMAMRFSLLDRGPTDPAPKHLAAPGLDVWQHSDPHVDIFRYHQEVSNLPPGGGVRALLTFRWLDASGRVIKHVTRRSPVCQVPDLRPHLAVADITKSLSSDPASDAYKVEIRNLGLGPASSFDVAVSVDGKALPTQTVDSLAPAALRILSFSGPHCAPGGTIQATADPDNRIDQVTRADDVKTISC